MSDGRLPIALAMIVCDDILVFPTGKRTIIGTLSNLRSATFPLVQPLLCVYLALTEGYGPFDFLYRIVDSDEARKPIYETMGSASGLAINPLALMELELRLTKLAFPTPGEYRIQFIVRDSVIAERRLFVNDHTSRSQTYYSGST